MGVALIRVRVRRKSLDSLLLGLFGTFVAGGRSLLLSAKYDWDPSVLVVLALVVTVSLQASRLPRLSGKKESVLS